MIAIRRPLLATCLLVPTLAGVSPADDVDRCGDPLPPGAVARLGTTRLRHSAVIQAMTYSPNGKMLVVASKSISVWDAANGKLIREMAANPHHPIRSLAIAPDGRTAAFPAASLNPVHVLEVGTGREIHRLSGHKPFSECVAFSPDGKVLATGGRDKSIRFWDLATGKELHALEYPGEFKIGQFKYLAYASGGKTLVSFAVILESPNRAECHLWDLATGKVIRRWEGACMPVAVSPDGKTLAVGAKGFRLQLWDLAAGKELRQFDLPEPSGGVIAFEAGRCAAFSPDGKLLAVGDLTDRMHVWDVNTGKELHRSPPFQDRVTCLAFSPDGKTLAVGNWHRILLWEATTGRDLLPLGGHANQVGRVAFAPDGRTVATHSEDALILWDPLTGRERQRFSDKRKLLAFSPGGDLLLGGTDGIAQWQPATGKTVRTWKASDRELAEDIADYAVAFSPDGKAMVSGTFDRTIRLWSLGTGEEVWRARRADKGVRFPADVGGHWPLGFTHDGKAVVSSAHDAVIRFWDAETGKEVRWFRIDSSEAALSPDGRFLVAVGKHTAAADGSRESSSGAPPRLWDLTTGREPRPVELYPKSAGSPTFSPDGSVVAVEHGEDIVLIERASAQEIRRLKGHQPPGVRDLAFSPDGRLLVSGGFDLTALVWDVTGLIRDGRFPEARLTPGELETAWADLSDADAGKAHRAIWKLVASPREAVPLLAGRLKPVSPVEPGHVAELVGDLGDTRSAVRAKATMELEKLAELAEPALRDTLDEEPPPEVRGLLHRLLEEREKPEGHPERLRVLRAVSVLGRVGSPDAREVLDALAKGSPAARLTQEAKSSRKRLAERAAAPR